MDYSNQTQMVRHYLTHFHWHYYLLMEMWKTIHYQRLILMDYHCLTHYHFHYHYLFFLRFVLPRGCRCAARSKQRQEID